MKRRSPLRSSASLRQRLRALVTMALAFVVWLVATPARAAAPQCDTRGATTFAPAPTLDPPHASIDIGNGEDPCAPSFALDAVHTGTRGGESGDVHGSAFEATLMELAPVSPAACARVLRPTPDLWGERSGIESSVERPPRG